MNYPFLGRVSTYCTPAKICLFLGAMHVFMLMAMNIGNKSTLRFPGLQMKYVNNTFLAILFQVVWLLAFGFFIDWLCRKRMKTIAWIVLLLPYISLILGIHFIAPKVV